MHASLPRKVLILTAAYGEGHNAAARALQAALARHPNTEPVLVDLLDATYGAVFQQTRRNYLKMIDERPRWWGGMYTALDKTPLVYGIAAGLGAAEKRLAKLLVELNPIAVVSVYPIYAYLIGSLYRAGVPRPFRLYTLVTDSLTINSVWHRAPSDEWFVPNEETAHAMQVQGIPQAKIRVTGFPVPPVFAENRPERPAPVNGGKVLYMINSGRKNAAAMVEALLRVPTVELTVTVGRDEELAREVRAAAARTGREVTVLGWVSNMPELVMSHHVLIGKAGGAAVQEALAARTPMIITKVLPGQEEGNARLLLKHGCAAVCAEPVDAAAQCARLFAEGGREWLEWETRMARVSRPDSALRLAEFILGETAPVAVA